MKSLFEEYGKIIVFTIIALILLGFALSNKTIEVKDPDTGEVVEEIPVGFLAILKEKGMGATTGTENNSERLQEYSKRVAPLLVVETKKLEAEKEYDLLSFVTEKKAQVRAQTDGNEEVVTEELVRYTLEITKIVDAEGNEMDLPESHPTDGTFLYTFPRLPESDAENIHLNSYRVTYKLTDYYYDDYPVTTTKTYQFVVD